MNEHDYEQPSSGYGVGIAALLLGVVVGAAALLLSTKPGQMLMQQVTDRAEDWKAQAAAAVADTREKMVSSVEAETPQTPDDGQRLREKL